MLGLVLGLVLGLLGLEVSMEQMLFAGYAFVAILTFGSGALYMRDWLHHMANGKQE